MKPPFVYDSVSNNTAFGRIKCKAQLVLCALEKCPRSSSCYILLSKNPVLINVSITLAKVTLNTFPAGSAVG